MVKARLKKWLTQVAGVREHRSLRVLGPRMRDPNLWHLNRRSVSGATAVGLFIAFWPIPLQMLVAGALAVWFRVNLPISVALVWISNPLTMPPIFYFSYSLGRWILDEPRRSLRDFELSWAWVIHEMLPVWKPLFLGSFVVATTAAIGGYIVIRILWRLSVIDALKLRRNRRETTNQPAPPTDEPPPDERPPKPPRSRDRM